MVTKTKFLVDTTHICHY